MAAAARGYFVSLDRATLDKEYGLQIPAELGTQFDELFISSPEPLKAANLKEIATTAIAGARYYYFLRINQPRIPADLAARFQRLNQDQISFSISPVGEGARLVFPESFQQV